MVLIDFVWHFLKRSQVKPFRFGKTKEVLFVDKDSFSPSALHKAKILVVAICTSTALVFMRSIYRCVELLGGVKNSLPLCIHLHLLTCTMAT